MGSDCYFSRLRRVSQLDMGALGPVLHFLPSIIMENFENLSDSHQEHLLSDLYYTPILYARQQKCTYVFCGLVTVIDGFSMGQSYGTSYGQSTGQSIRQQSRSRK